MGDHQGGAIPGDAVEGVLDVLFGVAVERRGRLVQQQDRRPLQDGAGDGDALLLAAGQLEAALADFGVVAFRRRLDEGIDLGVRRGRLDLGIARVPAATTDVVAHGR